MCPALVSSLPEPPEQPLQIEQKIGGDRNQAIGQVLGGMVVYVSGGQAVFHSASAELASSKAFQSNVGPNPYKGLMAFQASDGDHFFGREKQVAALWDKLRRLYEIKAAVRVLPIYGPSGSGKSSLVRAGLIPELGRRPIPGYERAQVAILVPGTHPLEALATVLAKIVTQDLTPVAKTRELAGELKQVNDAGEYDGLRRIADVLPEIGISPLIVLVDQFEEVYTLCEDKADRNAFVENLLCAASEHSQRVSVIVTLRSDFLGETQKHPALNALFAEQGFLVRSMNEAELRQAIAKPAELAGHSLDPATIDLLIKDTEGREGALPLLQFALTRIWEGLAEGKEPAETLEEIGGVGGALAGEAQWIYQQLNKHEQEIARRVFLGLVQLGEGTKDTRRRVRFDSLVSYQDQPEQVKRVIQLFSAPGVRLITLAAVGTIETVEVTHEALFDYWRQLQSWLEGSRSDMRFQRRLDEAARYWDEQGRPEGNLWRPPDLDLLKEYQQRVGDLTPLQMEFLNQSEWAENGRKRLRRLGISGLMAGLVLTTGLAILSIHQLQKAQRQRVEQLSATAEVLASTQPISAAINAIAAAGLSQSALVRLPNYSTPDMVLGSLLLTMQVNREKNLLQHRDTIWSVAISSDGKMVVSGSKDGTLSLWDAHTGDPIEQPLQTRHEDVINSVAFSPDNQKIASGSWDRTIRLWDVGTRGPIGQPLQGHEKAITSVAFSPDGETIASGSSDTTIRLWDVRTGHLVGQPLTGHEKAVTSVAFSPDGETIASGSSDTTIRLWDVGKKSSIGQPLRGHDNKVTSLAFSPDGETIASSSSDKTIRLWDVGTKRPIGPPLHGHEDLVWSVAFNPDGKTLVSGSLDKTIRLWDVETKTPIGQPLQGHEEEVYSVAVSRDGETIVSGSNDHTVRLWNTDIKNQIGQPLYGHGESVYAVVFSPDGKQVASGSRDNTLHLWDANTGKIIGPSFQGHEDRITCLAFSPDGKTIASGSRDETVRLWDIRTGKQHLKLQGHNAEVYSVTFSPDGKMIATGSDDKTVQLWDAETGKPIKQPLEGHSVAFSPDGKIIIRRVSSSTVQLWDAITNQPVGQPLQGHDSTIYSVTSSVDGKMIATGSDDKTVRLWDAETGKPIGHPLQGHKERVTSVAFSPDGKTLVSGSNDSTIRLWDSNTGEQIGQTLRGHADAVWSVAFSPDGKTVVSGSRDKSVRLWHLPSLTLDHLLQLSCNQLRYHSSLEHSQTNVAKDAKQTCARYF